MKSGGPIHNMGLRPLSSAGITRFRFKGSGLLPSQPLFFYKKAPPGQGDYMPKYIRRQPILQIVFMIAPGAMPW